MVVERKITDLTIDDLERRKFDLNDDSEVIVRTSADITGEITPSGLNVAVKITTLTVGTTAVKLPTTALTNRNAIAIHNKSSSFTLYVGPSTVTADSVTGTTSGWEVTADSFVQLDITDAVEIYGRCASGESAQVKVMELA
jgi:hypothetical protein